MSKPISEMLSAAVLVLVVAGTVWLGSVRQREHDLANLLFMQAVYRGDVPQAEAALRRGASVNAKVNRRGEVRSRLSPADTLHTSLGLATLRHRKPMLRFLLVRGADRSDRDLDGHSALWHARHPVWTMDAEEVRILKDAGVPE